MRLLTDEQSKDIKSVLKEYYDFIHDITEDLHPTGGPDTIKTIEANRDTMARISFAMSQL